MKQIASIWHLTVRKVLTALAGAAAFLFGACPWIETEEQMCMYGPGPEPDWPYETYDRISGTVIGDEKPVSGIFVSVYDDRNPESAYIDYAMTNDYGTYYLNIRGGSGYYTVRFVDVDGPLNGEYDSKTVQWCSGDGLLHIVLDPKGSEPVVSEPEEPSKDRHSKDRHPKGRHPKNQLPEDQFPL